MTTESRRKAEVLRAQGLTVDQVAAVFALYHPGLSPLRLYRCANGLTAHAAVDLYNQADPAGTAALRESRLYDFETWPDHGRRPPAWTLTLLAQVYGTSPRNLVTPESYTSYPCAEQEILDEGVTCQAPRVTMEWSRGDPADRNALPWETEPGTAPSAPSPRAIVDLFHALGGLEADVKRRDLLFQLALTLGGTASIPLLRRLTPGERDRLVHATTHANRIDAQTVSAIDKLLAHCRHLEDTHGPAKVLPTVDAQRTLVAELLKNGRPTAVIRDQLISTYAELCQFSGYLHADLLDYEQAKNRFNEGLSAAREANDVTMLAYLHTWLSELAYWQEQPHEALDHSFAALGWARRSPSPALTSWTTWIQGQARAANGEPEACLHAIDQAITLVPAKPKASDPRYLYWWMPAAHGASARFLVKARRPDEAITRLDRAFESFDRTFVHEHARFLLHYTEALVLKREIPAASAKLLEATDMTRTHSSARLAHEVLKARRKLEPWAGTSYVREADERLRAVGIT